MKGSIRVYNPDDIPQIELHRGICVYRPVPRHWHEEYQFCLVESGECDLTYRGSNKWTPPASLFIVHPGEVHTNRAFTSAGCTYRTILLNPELVRNIVKEFEGKSEGIPFFPEPIIFDRTTTQQFAKLHATLDESTSSLEKQDLLQTFLGHLLSRYSENRLSTRRFALEKKGLRRAYEYLNENYAENISLEKLSSVANLSPFHFSRIFAEKFGMPPHEFQIQLRILRAKSLLRKGLDISRIATQIGFFDQSHFTKYFKKSTGFTPAQYG